MCTPWTRLLLAVALVTILGVGSTVRAQLPGALGGAGRALAPSGIGLGGPLELLARRDVKQELELVDDQIEALDQLRQQLRDRRRQVFAELREAGDRDGARQRIQAALQESSREIRASLERILLPHQFSRLNQLQLQRRLRSGLFGALASPQVADRLGISDEQRRQLRETGVELEQELRVRIAELRQQAQAKLLARLTPQQRESFQELVGEPFEFQDEPRRRRESGGTPRPRPTPPTKSP